MKKILHTALIISMFGLSAGANAAVLDSAVLKEKIKQSVENQIKTETNKEVQVEIISVPYQKIETKTSNVEVKTQLNLKYINPVTIIRVSIFDDGNFFKSFTAQAKIDSPVQKTVNTFQKTSNINQIDKPSPVIIRNNTISIIFKADKVSVTIPGTALSNGCIGEFIKVRSDNYKKYYQGKVIGKNIVLVDI